MKKITLKKLFIPTLGIFFAATAVAQESTEMSKTVKEVVVTGVSNPKSALESSISITTLKAKDINNAVPRTTAEIFRTIPGIRSESSGGDGNSNITVRGVPISAGGSRYMLIQEDGLPVLQFGDIAFGTQDQFVRFDNTTSRIEALRGGSASVLASNSPAGILNFISKTGENEGGSLTQTFGLGYKLFRTDFEYGSKITDNLFYHVGGFYRTGDGPRATGYTSNNGGQMKASLTKKFEDGHARIYVKMLNDRTAAYMPAPIMVSGTDESPVWESLPNYDALTGTMYTPHLMQDRTIGGDNNVLTTNVSDGMRSSSTSIGVDFSKGLGEGFNVNFKARQSFNGGQFTSPFPTGTFTAGNTMMGMHLFNTTLNNFNNTIADVSVSKKVDIWKFNVGLYKSTQNVDMSWNWNSYMMDVNGHKANATLTAYGVPAWGNCCNRNYNTTYDILAPYATIEVAPDAKWNMDFGMRLDKGNVSGQFAGGNGQTAKIDMNGNGTIDANEMAVATFSNKSTAVNYNYDLISLSGGVNYLHSENTAFFARGSRGGTAQADRILFNGGVASYTNDADPMLKANAVNTVTQFELGTKNKLDKGAINATAFYTLTSEGAGFEASTQKTITNDYRSFGLEVDGMYKFSSDFSLRGSATFTKAEISDTKDSFTNGAGTKVSYIGNAPRRTPTLMFSLNPNLNFGQGHSIGFTAIGMTSTYASNENQLKLPAYVIVNPYVNFSIIKNLGLSLAASNVFDALAITESEEGTLGTNTSMIARARPFPGRTVSASLKLNF
jgi:outer membrane receptor protein involved in Fe transport